MSRNRHRLLSVAFGVCIAMSDLGAYAMDGPTSPADSSSAVRTHAVTAPNSPTGSSPALRTAAPGASLPPTSAEPPAFAGETPTFERVVALARERAPEVVVARAELEASRSVGVGARMSPILNPYLEVIAERGDHRVTRDLYVTAQLHTPIELGGQRGRRIAEADSIVDLHASTLESVRAQIAGAAVRSYGDCIAWAARHETLTELLASASTEAVVMGARRDAGDATERDAQLAEVERARIAVQLDETRASLGAALSELSRLTGQRFGPPDTTRLFPQVTLSTASTTYAPRAPAVLNAEAEGRFYARLDQRLERDRIPPMSVILQGGRGDLGETRLGAGLAWTLPIFRYNQGERARAQAESVRARATAATYRNSIAQRLASIAEEGIRLRAAVERLDREAIPAATMATQSATQMQHAGKTDLLSVVVARRDLYFLRLRRMEIAARAWELLGDWVELAGQLPR